MISLSLPVASKIFPALWKPAISNETSRNPTWFPCVLWHKYVVSSIVFYYYVLENNQGHKPITSGGLMEIHCPTTLKEVDHSCLALRFLYITLLCLYIFIYMYCVNVYILWGFYSSNFHYWYIIDVFFILVIPPCISS